MLLEHYILQLWNALNQKSKLWNLSKKNDLIQYKKRHNLILTLKKSCKKSFFDNLETKNNSKPLWSTSKPYFSNKHAKGDADILLFETNKILLDNGRIANVFNKIII